MEFKDSTQIEEYMWEGFRSAESVGLSKSRQSANDVNVEEEVQRVIDDVEKSEDVKEQSSRLYRFNDDHIKEQKISFKFLHCCLITYSIFPNQRLETEILCVKKILK